MNTKKIIFLAALQALLLPMTYVYAEDDNTSNVTPISGSITIDDSNVTSVSDSATINDSNATEISDGNASSDIPEGHIVNDITRVKAFPPEELSYSFTPDFKSIYDVTLLNIQDSCDDPDARKITLPSSSRFRQTHDREAQNKDEMIVHVYDVPLGEAPEDEVRERYFTTPFKVCLNGAHTVARSLYLREGGINTGVMLIPFKSYGGDIQSNSSAGGYISYQNDAMHWLGTVGFSQISVAANSDDTTATDTVIESQIGLMVAGGLVVEFVRNWDLSILIGFDHLLASDSGADWEHQDRPWIALGVGLNLTR